MILSAIHLGHKLDPATLDSLSNSLSSLKLCVGEHTCHVVLFLQ
jgi:hypothetical protein